MYSLNEKIAGLTPYEPIKGEYKIRLDANESFLNIPEYILAEIISKSFSAKMNRYPDPYAEDLCSAFAGAYQVDKANVVAGNGSDELISVIMGGFLMKGEKFATLDYDFSMYDFYGSLCEGKGVKIPKNADMTVNVQNVIDTCNEEDVKILIFSNPCNPTSIGLEIGEVRRIVNSVGCLVVLDEAYMDFWDQSLLGEVNDYDNLLILKTCSKAYGLAAVRVGFAVGNLKLINAIKAIKSPYNVNTISQITAASILRHRGESRAALGQIKQSRDELKNMLVELSRQWDMEILNTCTNFVTVKTTLAKELFEYLLSLGIAVRCFNGFLRITAGSYNENVQLIKFMEKFFSQRP